MMQAQIKSYRIYLIFVCIGAALLAAGCRDKKAKRKLPDAPDVTRPVAVDPMPLVVPSGRPQFREMLKREEFDKRMAEMLAKLPPAAEREQSKLPPFGLLVQNIQAGSQAERLGLHAGDTIAAADGKAVWSESQITPNAAHELTVISADGAQRKVAAKPGSLGITGEISCQLELSYLQNDKHDKRWDNLVRVALVSCFTDPVLAEMAMQNARLAGYPAGWTSDYMGVVTNTLTGRPAEAMEFAALLQKDPETAQRPMPYGLIYRSAVAEFKLHEALAGLQAQFGAPDALVQHLKEMISAHEALPETKRNTFAPSEQEKTLHHENLIPKLAALNDSTQWFIDAEVKNVRVQTAAPGLDGVSWVFAPKESAENVELTVKFSLGRKDADAEPSKDEMFAIGLLDQDNPQPAAVLSQSDVGGILGVRFSSIDGNLDVYHGNGQVMLRMPADIKQDLKQDITLRMIHLHGRDEIYLNNRRILYVPSTSGTKRVAGYIKANGMNARLWSVKFSALKDDR